MPPEVVSESSPVALITGGQGDLAQAITKELTELGHYTVHAPGRAELDVTSMNSITAYLARVERIDLAVCNAGILHDASLARMTEQDFDDVLDVGLSGAFRIARAVLPKMTSQGQGHLVFISSFSALRGPFGQTNYAAAKAGLLGLSASLAREYGPHHIRVNAILPGFLETKMTAHFNDEQREAVRNSLVLGRFNDVSSVARFIRFLERQLPHTSGQVFNLDSRIHRWT